MTQDITDQNFETEVNKDEGIVLVDFWAPWCGPCQMQGPIVDEVAEVIKNKAKVLKLNVDENQATAQKFGVMGIPTLILFQKGIEKERLSGVQSKETLLQKIKQLQ